MDNYSNSKYPLHTLFFEVTSRCNALCDHCGSRCTASKKDELSSENFKKVLDSVAENFGTKAIMLNITGGEPIMNIYGDIMVHNLIMLIVIKIC